MKLEFLDEELVLDRVTAALVERPRTFSELFGYVVRMEEPMPSLDQIDDALDVLHDAHALTTFKESRFGERLQIFALKSEARTYLLCRLCKGVGFQADAHRGMCPHCHGNGVYTPVTGSV